MERYNFLKQLSEELHKERRINFDREQIKAINNKNNTWGIDLIDLTEWSDQNKGYKYLVTGMDIYTRYAFVEAIKTKDKNEVKRIIQKFIKEYGTPTYIWCDQGKEFINKTMDKFLKSKNVELYHTYSKFHNPFIERFNRTFKKIMWKYFTRNNTRNYIIKLDKLVSIYNNNFHSSIKTKPFIAFNNPFFTGQIIEPKFKTKKQKFKVGDYVRISRDKDRFEKEDHNWSMEIFKIINIKKTNPPLYELEDYNKEKIKGSFYNEELQKTKLNNIFLVEKILKEKGDKVLIKWLSYSDDFNSWKNKKDVLYF